MIIEARRAKVKKDTRNYTGNMNANKGYFYFSRDALHVTSTFSLGEIRLPTITALVIWEGMVFRSYSLLPNTPQSLFSQTLKPLTKGATKGSHFQLYFPRISCCGQQLHYASGTERLDIQAENTP